MPKKKKSKGQPQVVGASVGENGGILPARRCEPEHAVSKNSPPSHPIFTSVTKPGPGRPDADIRGEQFTPCRGRGLEQLPAALKRQSPTYYFCSPHRFLHIMHSFHGEKKGIG